MRESEGAFSSLSTPFFGRLDLTRSAAPAKIGRHQARSFVQRPKARYRRERAPFGRFGVRLDLKLIDRLNFAGCHGTATRRRARSSDLGSRPPRRAVHAVAAARLLCLRGSGPREYAAESRKRDQDAVYYRRRRRRREGRRVGKHPGHRAQKGPETGDSARCALSSLLFPSFDLSNRSLTITLRMSWQFGALASLQAHAEEAVARHRARRVRHAMMVLD